MPTLGIDAGTSSVKVVLVDDSGVIRGSGEAGYPLETKRTGWVEQDPRLWWRGTVDAVREALRDRDARAVKAIGLSGQMHSLVLLDSAGEPVRPAICWADTRSSGQVEEFNDRITTEVRVATLGNPAAAGFTAPSLMWVRSHEPDRYRAARWAVLAKDYLRSILTGRLATDPSDASATLLFDVPARRWSHAVVEALGLSPELLPEVLGSREVAGELAPGAARELGLEPGVPVVTGAGDQAAAATGCGLSEPGPLLITLGSGGQLFAALDAPVADPLLRVHLFCHSREDRWHLLGAVQNVGLALDWVRRLFGWDWERFMAECASVGAGSEGLLFLPYLTGERTPHMDASARGNWFGLTLAHQPSHLARAALEGVTFALRDAFDPLEELGAATGDVVVSGGGARHPLRRQLLADVLARPVQLAELQGASAMGAAVLAGAPERRLSYYPAAEPGADSALYQEAVSRYRRLYRALRESVGPCPAALR